MAGAFSGHLIDQFNPNSPYNSSIVSHGAMSFNPNMHGTPQAQQSFSLFGTQASFGMAYDTISEETQRKIATLQVKLNQKLGPEFISQRPGPGGGPKLTYVEGWKIINLANEVFGFNGWSSSIVSLTTDFMDYNEESRKYNVGVTALIRVTLRDGVFHEDIGYGMLENSRSKGAALDKCKKEAVTDGLKRALRNFGNVMGNCLYDKSYAQEIVKIKFEPTKLNKDSLHRRPEFEDVKPVIPTATTTTTSNAAASSSTSRPNYPNNHNTGMNTSINTSMNTNMNTSMNTSSSRPMQQASSIPPHMQNMQQDAKGKAPAHHTNAPPAQRPPAPNHHQNNQNAAGQSRPPVSAPAPAPPKPNPVPNQKPNSALQDSDSQSHFFDSDDDAFLATVDLGPAFSAEADMGRPIMVDADMGQPINHEEGLMRGPDEYDDEDEEDHVAEEVKAVPVLKSSSSGAKSRHELIAAALSGSNDGNASMASNTSVAGAGAGGATAKPPSGQGGGGWSSITSGSSSSGMGTGTRQPPNLNGSGSGQGSGQPRATSLAQQNHQRYMAQRQQNDQNHNPAQNNSSSTSSTSALATSTSGEAGKRSGTNGMMQSSVGGFNFPPGMNPLASSNNANIPNFSAAGSGIGVKRPADAMGSSYTMSGRPSINIPPQAGANRGGVGGMSGFNGNGIMNGSGRSVLGALDITEGGDVKRRRP